ncbi:MAG: L-seryl-tRNA(Sec) selenium transferase [Planctomycetes bacterium]|nr:L-seryl-tRNA(Sec) selenium transferase [Planctomycetota bacterium]
MLRNIPSVNELLESAPLRRVVDRVSHHVVVTGVRSFLDNLRRELHAASAERRILKPAELAERIAEWILASERPRLRPAINATGILLHTGLGRAPLAESAIQAVADAARGYASLEIDLETGDRSQRALAVERPLRNLTGSESAFVVNNNAAATLVTLAALGAGREVVVSRGELIEIGGSYRLPEVMEQSGCRLREVGTTNKTRAADYERAIGPDTAALMKVHTSNYRVVGFTEEASIEELVTLGGKHALPVIDDIGSGALLDLGPYGIDGEPVAGDRIRSGADVVLFSGDKLLGGPQCGIIVGRKKWITAIMNHPLSRALRVDKMTLAALAATLALYRSRDCAEQHVPLLALLTTPIENLRNRAERLAPQLAAVPELATAEPIDDVTYLGGGSVPAQRVPTICIAVTPRRGTIDQLAHRLRVGEPAVVGRIQQDRLCLDLRSVPPSDDRRLVDAFEHLGAGP